MTREIVPMGQPTQLIGLPRLSDETYERLGKAMRELYESYTNQPPPPTTTPRTRSGLTTLRSRDET